MVPAWDIYVDFLSLHRVTAKRCTYPAYSAYAMCEGVLLWQNLKLSGLKVPTQYFSELIAQWPFKFGHVEHLVTAWADTQK